MNFSTWLSWIPASIESAWVRISNTVSEVPELLGDISETTVELVDGFDLFDNFFEHSGSEDDHPENNGDDISPFRFLQIFLEDVDDGIRHADEIISIGVGYAAYFWESPGESS